MGYIWGYNFGEATENPSVGKIEKDTTHCRHCQAVIDKKKWAQDYGIWKCSKCDGPVCHHCSSQNAPMLVCDPWQAKVDRQLAINEEQRKLKMG